MAESIVADAGPLIAFARIDALEVLAGLFSPVWVAQTVLEECTGDPNRPGAGTILAAAQIIRVHPDPKIEALLPESLSLGDQTTIQLALNTHGRVLLDDLRARKSAQHLGARVVGSIGVLLQAKRLGHLAALQPALDAMRAHHYRIGDDLYRFALQEAGER